MSKVSKSVIDENLHDLHVFIEDNFAILRHIVSDSPKSFNIKSNNSNYDEAWRTGFRRCLAELERIAERHKTEGRNRHGQFI